MAEQVKSPFLQDWLILNELDYDLFPSCDRDLGYLLKKGDVIKFGRVRFMVTQISGEDNTINTGMNTNMPDKETLDFIHATSVSDGANPSHSFIKKNNL